MVIAFVVDDAEKVHIIYWFSQKQIMKLFSPFQQFLQFLKESYKMNVNLIFGVVYKFKIDSSFLIILVSMERRIEKAGTQYSKRMKDARYYILAQKLSQHFQQLHGDPNTKVRWIWELIQNAKDAPNSFGKVKIKIEIKDKKLKFSHNGDPFKIKDLETLVGQYSSKPEQNKQDTTGKYGTGFITTYILSKIITIKGILHLTTENNQIGSDQQKKSQNSDSDDEAQSSGSEKSYKLKSKLQRKKEQKRRKQKQLKKKKGKLQQSMVSQKYKKQSFGHFNKNKNDSSSDKSSSEDEKNDKDSGYQKFEIKLDRSYDDRDRELVKKLKKSEKNIQKYLDEAELQQIWQREEDDLDTTFIYEELDNASFRMIQDAVDSVRNLMGYCLIFNEKIYAIEVIDKRKVPKFSSFSFERGDEEKLENNVYVTDIKYIDDKIGEKILSFAFSRQSGSQATVAVPIERLQQQKFKLLRVNNKYQKMFKEFPLIGHEDIGFNFVLTSKKFYPNETRSNILLRSMEDRSNYKVDSNWGVLKDSYQQAFQLYLTIGRYISDGVANFLILKENNYLSAYRQFKQNQFPWHFKLFKEKVSKLKMIPFRNKKIGCLRDLIYIKDDSDINSNKKDYSRSLNEQFYLFFGNEYTLTAKDYEDFFDVIDVYKTQWHDVIKFVNLDDSLKQMGTFTFNSMVRLCENNIEEALLKLDKIYQLLYKNADRYLSDSKSYKIVLTNSLELKEIKVTYSAYEKELKVKQDLPLQYQKLAKYLYIQYNSFLIHDKFAKYFKKKSTFGINQMQYMMMNVILQRKETFTVGDIVFIGRFLSTFNLKHHLFDMLGYFTGFENITEHFECLTKEEKNTLALAQDNKKNCIQLLTKNVIKYFEDLLKTCSNFNFFKTKFLRGNQNDENAFQILNNMLVHIPQCPVNLAWNHNFYPKQKLRYYEVSEGNPHPDERDISFYDQMRIQYNILGLQSKLRAQIRPMKQQILHPKVKNVQKLQKITFKELFGIFPSIYDKLKDIQHKSVFLDYINKIYDDYNKRNNNIIKYETFKEIIKIRHQEQLKMMKDLVDEERDFIFNILKKREQITAAKKIMDKYNFIQVLAILEQRDRQHFRAPSVQMERSRVVSQAFEMENSDITGSIAGTYISDLNEEELN